jgi:histone acetyltransferase (RNA polymerase elongator complex component)
MAYGLAVAPVLVPHRFCARGCPYCAGNGSALPELHLPTAEDVRAAVARARARQVERGRSEGAVELAFFGGDFWQLPRAPRTALLDAAEGEVRCGRVVSFRLTLSPQAVLRAPLAEFRARGVAAVELPIHSLDSSVLKSLGMKRGPRLGLEAVGRLHRAQMRSIVHISPGLPSSCHRSALVTVEGLVRVRPTAARVLPALALSDTRLGELFEAGRWQPMTLGHGIATCKHVVRRLREKGIEVVRVGLQPGFDLAESPEVYAGPYHPDLRAMVEAEIMRERATRALTSVFSFGTRAFSVVVHPRDEGNLRGPNNCNIHSLVSQFRLDQIHVLALADQPRGSLRIFPGKLRPSELPRLPRKKRHSKAS